MNVVHACLAEICHLHFWQNDRGLLRATAVTLGGGWMSFQPSRCCYATCGTAPCSVRV